VLLGTQAENGSTYETAAADQDNSVEMLCRLQEPHRAVYQGQ
jgi:hypothetical protein